MVKSSAKNNETTANLWASADAKQGFRDRREQSLLIDAHKLGTLIDRASFNFLNN
jgi:hypothetical protein